MFSFHNPSCIFYNPNEKYITLSWRREVEDEGREDEGFHYNSDVLGWEKGRVQPAILDLRFSFFFLFLIGKINKNWNTAYWTDFKKEIWLSDIVAEF